MQKFCPRCGSSVQEEMRFCKTCGAVLPYEEVWEERGVHQDLSLSKKTGRKKQVLLIAALAVLLLVAGLGWLFSQNSLTVQSDPAGAGVYLDSEFRGVTPGVIHYILPGEHTLEFRYDGYPPWQKTVPISLGQAETISADLSDNLIADVSVACFSDETLKSSTGAINCIYKKGEAVSLSGTAVRPHPKENPAVTISVYAEGTKASPLHTQKAVISPNNSYNLTFDSTTLPGGNYNLVASLPSGQNSTIAFTIESQEDTNIRILRQIVEDYHKIHTYSLDDYFVCADMALDVWNIVDTKGMRAVLVAGNIEDPAADWTAYNHVWVIVEAAPGQWVALETTGGFLVYKNNNPNYYRGTFFENPKDLKTNMDLRRDYNNEIGRYTTAVNQYNAKLLEYTTVRDNYRSLVDSYNNNYVGKNLSALQYQESLTAKSTLDSELAKQALLATELDQLTLAYNREKQIMDTIRADMMVLDEKGKTLVSS